VPENRPIWDRPAEQPPPGPGGPSWQPPAPGGPPAQPPPGGPYQQPPPRKRRRGLKIVLGIAGAVVVIIIAGAVAAALGGQTSSSTGTAAAPPTSATPQAASTPAAPAPVPSPNASGTGTCDVSLGTGLNGPNYLVAEVDVNNTGNIGEVVKVTVSWPQVGFAPIVKHKAARIPFGGTAHVNLRANAADYSGDVIGNFQNYQLSHPNSDACNYTLTEVSTFGSPH
jgi:hypothetical protein